MSKVIETKIYKLTISEDLMKAELEIAPEESGLTYSTADIMNFLNVNGIRMGIKTDKINQMVEEKIVYVPMTIAEGKTQIDGANGHYDILFNTQTNFKPEILEDGSVDYLNAKMFEEVKAGTEVARYVHCTPGEFGFNIMGKLLTPKKGRELSPLRGRGIERGENGDSYFASITGKIEYKFGEINVNEVYEHRGNLDMSHNNIRFSGDVKIFGDVESGMTIDAQGSVEVTGHVAGATIKSGKDIILKRGVQGGGKAVIEAKGNVFGQFFEDAHIEVQGNLEANYLLNCDTYVTGRICIRGKQGVILGGKTHGVRGIEVQDAGNEIEVPTAITIGISNKILAQYAALAEKLKNIEDELKVLESGIEKVNMAKSMNLSVGDDMTSAKLMQAKIIKNAEKNKCLDQRKDLFAVMNEAGAASFGAHGNIYPGVFIKMDAATKRINKKYTNSLFKVINGDFVMRSMD